MKRNEIRTKNKVCIDVLRHTTIVWWNVEVERREISIFVWKTTFTMFILDEIKWRALRKRDGMEARGERNHRMRIAQWCAHISETSICFPVSIRCTRRANSTTIPITLGSKSLRFSFIGISNNNINSSRTERNHLWKTEMPFFVYLFP